MPFETFDGAGCRPLPRSRAPTNRQWIVDDPSAHRDERRLATKHEAIASTRDHRLVEHDTRGRARAWTQRAAHRNDPRPNVGGAEMKPETRARTQRLTSAR